MYDLRREDFEKQPVWAFCLDEEEVDGQTEETVRPCNLQQLPANSLGSFLVAADVIFGDGTHTLGYLFSDEHDAKSAFPAAFINEECVQFVIPGSRKNLTRELLDERKKKLYDALSIEKSAVFPVVFQSLIPVKGAPIKFVLDGFILLCENGQTVR